MQCSTVCVCVCKYQSVKILLQCVNIVFAANYVEWSVLCWENQGRNDCQEFCFTARKMLEACFNKAHRHTQDTKGLTYPTFFLTCVKGKIIG